MINKGCILTKKGKLYVILHGECKFTRIETKFRCNGCSYDDSRKRYWMYEVKEDMKLNSNIDPEEEFQNLIDFEIFQGQEEGYIRKDIC